MTDPDERIRDYVAGLPDASGTFTGTFSSDADVAALGGPPDALFPVDIDTGDRFSPGAMVLTELRIKVMPGGKVYVFPVARTEMTAGSNRVRLWCRRPHAREQGEGAST